MLAAPIKNFREKHCTYGNSKVRESLRLHSVPGQVLPPTAWGCHGGVREPHAQLTPCTHIWAHGHTGVGLIGKPVS